MSADGTDTMRSKRVFHLCLAGLIAAMYVVLTMLVGVLNLAGGAIQVRVSEALCVLAVFTPAAVPGMTIGCLVSNLLLGGFLWQDIVFGTLATFLGALCGRLLRRYPALVPLPTVLLNTAVIPFVLAYGYHAEQGLPILMLTVGIGELISAYLLGMILYAALRRHRDKLFS